MPPASSRPSLTQQLESRFLPPVLVLASPEVEEAAARNGVDFVSLLRPFTTLPRKVHAKTVGDLYPLVDFRVRLTDLQSLPGVDDAAMTAWFQKLAKNSFDVLKRDDMMTVQDVEGTLELLAERCLPEKPDVSDAKLERMTAGLEHPLMDVFLREYCAACRYSCYDTLDHPTACILAVSAASTDVVGDLKKMYAARADSFLKAAVDSQQLMYYVLVHDAAAPVEQAKIDRSIQDMKTSFGTANSKLLCINTNTTGSLQVDAQKWLPKATVNNPDPLSDPASLCIRLSPADEAEVQTLMYDFIERGLLQHMTRRIRSLDQLVSEKRQGKLGKMVSYFLGNKSDQPSRAKGGGPHFAYDSCEMQMRKLADLCFFLRDYDSAGGMYKNLKSELGSQESKGQHLYHGAALEGLGLCQAMANRRDAEATLEQAAQLYTRGGRSDYALRARLEQHALLRERRSYRAAETMRLACSIDEKKMLRCGVFLEAAAHSYLCSEYGGSSMWRVRKFAFNLTLAGYRYASAECVDHALRVTLMAAAVYRKLSLEAWVPINEHIQITLARLWAHKQQAEKSLHHMGLYIVSAQRTDFPRLKEYSDQLRAYVAAEQRAKAKEGALKGEVEGFAYEHLPLPVIDTSSVMVQPEPHLEKWHGDELYQDQHLGSLCAKNTGGVHKEWTTMESDLATTMRAEYKGLSFHPGVERQRKARRAKKGANPTQDPGSKQLDYEVVTQGETVTVSVRMSNPLSVPITVAEACILYEVLADNPSPMVTVNPPAPDAVLQRATASASFTIPAREERVATLEVTPQVPGHVRLVGVEWLLSADGLAEVRGRTLFYRTACPEKGHRVLTLRCVPAAPLMRCEVLDGPPLLRLHGEVSTATLRLRNIGSKTMGRVAVQVSPANQHLCFIDFSAARSFAPPGEGEDAAAAAAAAAADAGFGSVKPLVSERLCSGDGTADPLTRPTCFLFSEGGMIVPGGYLDVPVVIRSEAGNNSQGAVLNHVPFVFGYSSVGLPAGGGAGGGGGDAAGSDSESASPPLTPSAQVRDTLRFARLVVRSIVLPGVSVRALCMPPSCVRPGDEADASPEFLVSVEVKSHIGRLAIAPPQDASAVPGIGEVYNHRVRAASGAGPVCVEVEQVSYVSEDWDATPLDTASLRSAVSVYPNSAFSVPYRVRRRRGGAAAAEEEAGVCFATLRAAAAAATAGKQGAAAAAAARKAEDTRANPHRFFIAASMHDADRMTGGAGGVGLPPVLKDGAGMAMFLDRKEKKFQATYGLDGGGGGGGGDAAVADASAESYPLTFSVFWSVTWDVNGSPRSGQRRVSGHSIVCCLPAAAAVPPQTPAVDGGGSSSSAHRKWQDQATHSKNLILARTAGAATDASSAVVGDASPTGSPTNRAGGAGGSDDRPPKPLRQNAVNMLGVSVSFAGATAAAAADDDAGTSTVRHNFNAVSTACSVDVAFTLTNYSHEPRDLWVSLKGASPLDVCTARSAPPPSQTHGSATGQGAHAAAPPPALQSGGTRASAMAGQQQPQQQSQQRRQQPQVLSYPAFLWHGKTKHKVRVPAFGCERIVGVARFTRPGVYNANQVEVKVVGAEGSEAAAMVVQGAQGSGGDRSWLLAVVHDDEAPPVEEQAAATGVLSPQAPPTALAALPPAASDSESEKPFTPTPPSLKQRRGGGDGGGEEGDDSASEASPVQQQGLAARSLAEDMGVEVPQAEVEMEEEEVVVCAEAAGDVAPEAGGGRDADADAASNAVEAEAAAAVEEQVPAEQQAPPVEEPVPAEEEEEEGVVQEEGGGEAEGVVGGGGEAEAEEEQDKAKEEEGEACVAPAAAEPSSEEPPPPPQEEAAVCPDEAEAEAAAAEVVAEVPPATTADVPVEAGGMPREEEETAEAEAETSVAAVSSPEEQRQPQPEEKENEEEAEKEEEKEEAGEEEAAAEDVVVEVEASVDHADADGGVQAGGVAAQEEVVAAAAGEAPDAEGDSKQD